MKQEVMAHCPPTSPRCRWAVGFPRSDPRVTTVSPLSVGVGDPQEHGGAAGVKAATPSPCPTQPCGGMNRGPLARVFQTRGCMPVSACGGQCGRG